MSNNKKKFSLEDINFMKENYKLGEQYLADKFNTTRKTIRKYKKLYNLPKNRDGRKKGVDLSYMHKALKLKYPNGTRKGSKCSIETINKIKLNHADFSGEKHPMWGKHHKPESIIKMIKNHKGMLGKHQSEQMKEKYRIKRINWNFPKKDSSIEIKIQNFLKLLGINFLAHYHISEIKRAYQCDIFISPNIIIECDGDYWHGNTNNPKFKILNDSQIKQRKKDLIRDIELRERGYIVIRLWERDIRKMNLSKFKEILDNLNELNRGYFQDKNNSELAKVVK